MMQHAYYLSMNPRLRERDLCGCGRPECEHPAPAYRPRNLEYEREITEEAAHGVVDPQALIEFSEMRAGQDHGYGPPGTVRTDVDWVRMGREEGADWRNYTCWWLEENPGDPRAQNFFLALRYIAFAYDLITREPDE